MKYLFLSILLSQSSLSVKCQEKQLAKEKQNLIVETNQEPYYPKGESELYEFVNRNIQYSESAKSNKLNGTVTLSFDVKADSTIINPLVIQGIDPDIDDQLKIVIVKLKFAPAIQNGFKMKMNIMMNFPLSAH